MLDQLNQSLDLIVNQTWNNLYILLGILCVLWCAFILTMLTGRRLLFLGIIPRTLVGLRGVIFAPFLHVNFNHLFFNSIPLVVLANFILVNGVEYFMYITLLLTILSGLITWVIAKPGIHIGASSVITGYWTILACNVFQQPTFTSVILGIISIYYFAGIFFGIFPSGNKGVSWEGHLSGFLAGLILYFCNLWL